MNELQTPLASANAGVKRGDLIMESLTIKQLEFLCAAFESVFGEDADFMVWLANIAERRPSDGEGGLQ